jgi:hypothetical protein
MSNCLSTFVSTPVLMVFVRTIGTGLLNVMIVREWVRVVMHDCSWARSNHVFRIQVLYPLAIMMIRQLTRLWMLGACWSESVLEIIAAAEELLIVPKSPEQAGWWW